MVQGWLDEVATELGEGAHFGNQAMLSGATARIVGGVLEIRGGTLPMASPGLRELITERVRDDRPGGATAVHFPEMDA